MCADGVEHDVVQKQYALSIPGVICFDFESADHGSTVLNYDLPLFLSYDYKTICSLKKKIGEVSLTPLQFSILLRGQKAKLKFFLHNRKRAIKKKLIKIRNRILRTK